MAKNVIFLPGTQGDVTEIHEYYESQVKGLGVDFLRRIEAALDRLGTQPESCPVVMEPFRRLLVRRFPYAIFYEWTKDAIWVHAVFHCARDPQTVWERLRRG